MPFVGKGSAIGMFNAYGMRNQNGVKRMNDETITSAEEFFTDEMFGDSPEEKTPVRMDKARGKRSKKNLFAGIKVKMVMRIYGVTKARRTGQGERHRDHRA